MESNIWKIILFAVIFSSCGVNNNLNQSVNTNDRDVIKDHQIDKEKTYKFSCGEREWSIVGKNIIRPYFPIELRNCLLEKGFNGDQEVNQQIASLIRMVKMDDFLIFGTNDKFRGPQVFEALLSVGNDFSPVIDYDDGSITGTKAQAFGGTYLKMIKYIDGKEHNILFMELWQKNRDKIPNEYDPETLEYNFQYDVEWSKIMYNAIAQAWKENKIILKEFGEE